MADEAVFDPSLMKKKKKKKATVNFEADGKENADENAEQDEAIDAAADEPAGQAADLADMFGDKKKKKKKPKTVLDDMDEPGAAGGAHADVAGSDLIDYPQWPDWTYEELLDRVYNIMREKNPELATGEKKKFVMKPPQCMRVGSKKTGFANFAEICRLLKRNQKHVLQFILAELGTSGSVDGNNQLIVKGRFQQKHFELVLKKYIKEYVTCHTCKSPDTALEKDTRLFFLQCNVCGSRCSVATIKSGFVANTTRRAAIRAATGK